jgi:LacI family transcriptional regulator
MAVTDQCARHVLLSADDAGVAVPEEAAIVGVGNEAWSEVALRGLSSVELDGLRAGYVAAEMLHQLMDGKKIKPGVVRIPPRRLVIRRSSSTTAIDDPDVLQAMHFIAERATSGIGVPEVADAVPLSRRSLERRFEQVLGRSIHQEIRAVQVERAKLLLTDETVPLRRVASVAGFGSADAFAAVFRRVVGMTPSAYRKAIVNRPQAG